ncbi:MAG: hypothetical protein GY933_07800 [Hyphomicrobiales bacterium]|nr:hypothetical protein [Hyphomicrobiales bacterium]
MPQNRSSAGAEVIEFAKTEDPCASKDKPANAFYLDRAKWIEFVCRAPGVSHCTFRVAAFIAFRINAKDKTCWWSVRAIADEIGCTNKMVSSATKELQELGLLSVSRKPGSRNNLYELIFLWQC